ncbi:hypothetical protein [Vulgatibacter sp.]|uniref:hypothetical protein n=1 Tax=Vulgatibacter sp. TaxID=1971226 RepID=UPI00356187BB
MFGITLRKLPWYAKVMITGYLIAIAGGYVYAMGNLALAVGLTPDDIVTHYYGNEATQQHLREEAAGPKVAAGEAVEEELDLDLGGDEEAAPAAAAAAEAAPEEEILPIPSFKSLVGEGHFHMFGMTSFFFGLTLIALFLEVGEKRKAVLVLTPYVGILFDNLSMLATRFLGPGFAFLMMASGTLMALSFLGIFVHAMYEMWLKRSVVEPVKESAHALAA